MAETQRGGLAEKEIEQVLTLLLVIFVILIHQFINKRQCAVSIYEMWVF